MSRKLASVQIVDDVIKVPNAKTIDLIKVLGYTCMVAKDQFKKGDVIVYLENDSVPPELSPFKFLWSKTSNQKRPPNYYLKVKTVLGHVCQGLALPLSDFIGLLDPSLWIVGTDLTEALGVEKYEAEEYVYRQQDKIVGNFPSCIPKTDEVRLQSEPKVLQELVGEPYVVTLKYDGTSSTFLIDPTTKEFKACSRNNQSGPGSLYHDMALELDIENKLRSYHNGRFAIQGEICGPKLNGNRIGLSKNKLFVFNVFDLQESKYLNHFYAHDIVDALGLDYVKVLLSGNPFLEVDLYKIKSINESKYEGTDNYIEGVVVRHANNHYSKTLQSRLSFKIISDKYLEQKRC